MSSTKHKKPWDYPDCPICDSDVFVNNVAANKYKCECCGDIFTHDGGGGDTAIQPPYSQGHNNGGLDNIIPPTDEEIKHIYDDADKFVVPKHVRRNDGRQHLHQNGDTLCPDHVGAEETRVVDASVYPLGYNKICKTCVKQWRANDPS